MITIFIYNLEISQISFTVIFIGFDSVEMLTKPMNV